jgi:hypothetical protein
MQNRREQGKLQFSAKDMNVLMQNQTTKKFGPFSAPFLINLPKVRAQTLPAPSNFFSAPFVFYGRNFGPLATLVVSRIHLLPSKALKVTPNVIKLVQGNHCLEYKLC